MVDWQSESDLDSICNSCNVFTVKHQNEDRLVFFENLLCVSLSLCFLKMMFSFVWPLYSFHNWVMSLIMVIDWFIGRGCSSHHSVNIRNNRLCQLFRGLINPGKNFFFIFDDTFDCSFVVLSSQERTFYIWSYCLIVQSLYFLSKTVAEFWEKNIVFILEQYGLVTVT